MDEPGTDWRMREPRSDEGARDHAARSGGWVRSGPRQAARRPADGDGSREVAMVPPAEFTSYYGRPVLKPPAWGDNVAYYFFLGGLAAGSSLLGAGADLTGRPSLRRAGRVGALGSLALGTVFLIRDLGRPDRFINMLRVAKLTSPMSVGSWILTAFGPGVGVAAASELMPQWLHRTRLGRVVAGLARPAGLASAAVAPAVASYTAALVSQTAVPAWNAAHPELPFIFTGSSAASAGGLGMLAADTAEAGPARRLALYGALVELGASQQIESRLGLVGEAFTTGEARVYLDRARWLTMAGVLGSNLFGHRSRLAAAASGTALLAGGFYERLGLFRAGQASATDPKYTVIPQRARLEQRNADST
jgi:formate-dependent nitrite reductase membrane component NrfD